MPTAADLGDTDVALHCPKCEVVIDTLTEVCPRCGRHLTVWCSKCGQDNYRGNERCGACGHRLRYRIRRDRAPTYRHVWPVKWHWQRRRWWVLPGQLAAFAAAVALAVLAAVMAGRLGDRTAPIQPEDPYPLGPAEAAWASSER